MRAAADSQRWKAFQTTGGLPKIDIELLRLLLATVVLLLTLRSALAPPQRSALPDAPSKILSSYLVDTEFLAGCAERCRSAFAQSPLLAPEIRVSFLKLTASPK